MLTADQLRASMEPDEDVKAEIEDKIMEASGRGVFFIESTYPPSMLGWLSLLGYEVNGNVMAGSTIVSW